MLWYKKSHVILLFIVVFYNKEIAMVRRYEIPILLVCLFFVFSCVIVFSQLAYAHCDMMDGPVIDAAKKALDTGNVNLVLIWVKHEDEGNIKKVFENTISVRKLSPQAKEMADMYFFETLVRIHRAGEGAPYNGIKPAGSDMGLAIPEADRAITDGSAEKLEKLLTTAMHEGIEKHFREVSEKKGFKAEDVKAGREYVDAYVRFMHYIEGVFEAAHSEAHGHYEEK